MKQDISNEIEKIISYCKSKECDECKYRANDDLCNLHNPTAWNVNQMNEKEAIETYKNFLDDISKNGGCTIDIDFQHKKEYEAMWKILNILKEQQEEIEKYKMLLTRTNAQFINDTIETGKKNKEDLEMLYNGCQAEMETLKRDFEIVDHECSRLEKADIKKDKTINLMAEQLTGLTIFDIEKDEPLILGNKEDVIEYFNKKIEKGE